MSKPFVDRRKGPDKLTKFIRLAGVISWAIFLLILIVFGGAQPKQANFFNNVFNIPVDRPFWDTNLLFVIIIISFVQLAFVINTLILTAMRHKRKSDKYSKSLIAIGIMTLGLLIFSLYKLF